MHAIVLNLQRLQILTVCLHLPGCVDNTVLCMKDLLRPNTPEFFSLLALRQRPGWGGVEVWGGFCHSLDLDARLGYFAHEGKNKSRRQPPRFCLLTDALVRRWVGSRSVYFLSRFHGGRRPGLDSHAECRKDDCFSSNGLDRRAQCAFS